jgi:hypothetical protein
MALDMCLAALVRKGAGGARGVFQKELACGENGRIVGAQQAGAERGLEGIKGSR